VLKKKVERRSQTIQSESQTPDHKQVSIISSSNLKKKRERNIPVISFFRVLNIKSLFEIGRVNGCQKRQVVSGSRNNLSVKTHINNMSPQNLEYTNIILNPTKHNMCPYLFWSGPVRSSSLRSNSHHNHKINKPPVFQLSPIPTVHSLGLYPRQPFTAISPPDRNNGFRDLCQSCCWCP
jgi:hypothetical protein